MTLFLEIALAGVLAHGGIAGAQSGCPSPAAGDRQNARVQSARQIGTEPKDAQAADPATQALTEAIAIQVALDRAGFSPGVIDGQMGANTCRAIRAYEKQHGSPVEPVAQPLTSYAINEQDVSGPFAQSIPADLVKQAELPALNYTSPIELLAERFHTVPEVLERLNPAASFAAGVTILVPHVTPFIVPARRDVVGTSGQNGAQERVPALPKPEVVVTVSKSAGALNVRDAGGRVIFYAPVTTGSDYDPLPIGEWSVTGVHLSPVFNYNPDLFWDADPSHAKARIAPGPNNPVGVVWIDLSKDHYGIHGTPEPASVGKTASHGCVRLTNWDAAELASFVKPGTRVVFAQ